MRLLGLLLIALSCVSSPMQAQRTIFTVSGFPVTFPTPTAAELTAGAITSANAITFTVNAQTGNPSQRTTTVSIRCQAPCPQSGTKSIGTLRWRRADLAAWNTLTTSDVVIETRPVFRNQPLPASNDPWSNSLYWQFLVDWMSDTPGTSTFNIVMTLTVTVP
jgi:hypothetical protein